MISYTVWTGNIVFVMLTVIPAGYSFISFPDFDKIIPNVIILVDTVYAIFFNATNPNLFLGDMPRARTFIELVNEYIRLDGKNQWAVSSYETNTSLIEKYIKPLLGDIRLDRINPRSMSWFEAIRNKYKPKVRDL